MLTAEPFATVFSALAAVCFVWAGVTFAIRWLRRSMEGFDDSRGFDES